MNPASDNAPGATAGPAALAPAWFERSGAVIVPRRMKTADRIRVALAWLATAAAFAFAIAGYAAPGWVGLDTRDRGLLYLTAPPLIIGALLHLFLIVTGARRPVATFTRAGVQIHGYYLKSDEITRIWIQHNPMDLKGGALMVGTSREDAAPALVAVPPGFMDDAELSRLFNRIKQVRA